MEARERILERQLGELRETMRISVRNVRAGNSAEALGREHQYMELDEIDRKIISIVQKQARLACKKAVVSKKIVEMKVRY